jgi:flagellar biosynthesis chaperone FliJ
MEGIMEHAWFNRTLPEKYAKALEEMRAEQKALDELSNAKFRSKLRDAVRG